MVFKLIIIILFSTTFIENSFEQCILTGNSLENVDWIQSNCNDIIIRNFTVPAGQSLNLTSLQPGSTVTFSGTFTFDYEEWKGWIIYFSGTDLTIIGEPGSVIDGDGARWWDGLGGNGGKLKPKIFRSVRLYNSLIRGINIKNSPKHVFSICTCENVTYTDITIDNLDGDTQGGHNTDGFDINESDNITISNITVYNQDDCIAVSSGRNYQFYDNFCSGGHGISIGGVGNNTMNLVENVIFKNCTVVNSENGVRIKTQYNTFGEVRNITYEDITIGNITAYGILVRGDYKNSGPTGTPTNGVTITDFYLNNIHGWVDWNATNVYVLLADGAASRWNWTNIDVTGSIHTDVECVGFPENSGVVC